MINKCPNCGEVLESATTQTLKTLARNMNLGGVLADYLIGGIPQKDWHPRVEKFAYDNLVITTLTKR